MQEESSKATLFEMHSSLRIPWARNWASGRALNGSLAASFSFLLYNVLPSAAGLLLLHKSLLSILLLSLLLSLPSLQDAPISFVLLGVFLLIPGGVE